MESPETKVIILGISIAMPEGSGEITLNDAALGVKYGVHIANETFTGSIGVAGTYDFKMQSIPGASEHAAALLGSVSDFLSGFFGLPTNEPDLEELLQEPGPPIQPDLELL